VSLISKIYSGKLYWLSDAKPPTNIENAFFFNIDNDLTYMPFNKDFGPLNLAMVHRYCRELNKLLKTPDYQGKALVYHYTKATNDNVKLTNSAFLVGAYMIVSLKMSAR
jgi:cell division cycle 14